MEKVLFWAMVTAMETAPLFDKDVELGLQSIRAENIEALVPPYDMMAPRETDDEGRFLFVFAKPNDPPKGTVELRVTMPGIAPDFLHLGLYFVSSDWRDAAKLTEDEVLFFDVDASQSLPEVQAKDYKVLWPVAVRDWIDLERAGTRLYPPGPHARLSAHRPIFKDGVRPDVNLFHTPHFPHLFVTEALAKRLADAGLEVDFADYSPDLPAGASPPLRGR